MCGRPAGGCAATATSVPSNSARNGSMSATGWLSTVIMRRWGGSSADAGAIGLTSSRRASPIVSAYSPY